MRFHIAFFAFLQIATCLSHADSPRLPEDAVELKQAYEAAREKALKPIEETYEKELNRLLEQHTKSGNVDEATAIRAELASLTRVEAPSRKAIEVVTADMLANSKVIYHDPTSNYVATWLFREDGSVSVAGSGRKGTWKIDDDILKVVFGKNWNSFTTSLAENGSDYLLEQKDSIYGKREGNHLAISPLE